LRKLVVNIVELAKCAEPAIALYRDALVEVEHEMLPER
jgi:hypothetical protein